RGAHLCVNLVYLAEALLFLPAVDARRGDNEGERRQEHARRQRAPGELAAEDVVWPAQHGRRLGTLARKRGLAIRPQPLGGAGIKLQPLIQEVSDPVAELL